jgi:hypothetical protein
VTNRPPTLWLAWLVRAAWVAVLVVATPAIDTATGGRGDAVADVARYGGAAIWLAGVVALSVPAVVTLTAARVVVPLSVPAAAVALAAGADNAQAAGFVVAAVVATALVLSAELGRSFVQASAYGDEARYPLRPPLAYSMAAVLTWVLWAAALLSGPLLLADHRWIAGAALTAIAVGLGWWGWPRWHKLARRWFVIVPVGVVVHDHVVLAETLMVRRNDLAGLRLAPADTQAADLTGPATGHALELLTHEPVTAILAASPKQPGGTAIHLTGALVSPTRPGQVLAAARSRRMPVG